MHHEFYFLAKKIVENKSENKLALATIIRVKGSAYRREGTRMIILKNGDWFGNISGGCLEGDILRKALSVIDNEKSMLVTYDTRESKNKEIRVALGCNGIIDILIEPVTTEVAHLCREILNIFDAEQTASLKTQLKFEHKEVHISRELKKISSSEKNELPEKSENFCEVIRTSKGFDLLEMIGFQRKLVIWGSGPDTIPLANFSRQLGWKTIVVAEKISKAQKEKIEGIEFVETIPENIIDKVNFHQNTAIVLVSHDYYRDYFVLEKVVNSDLKYIGIMGPKRRGEKMLEELKSGNQGIQFSNNNLYYPVGIDIGSDNPVEIALSIVSEIQSVFSGKKVNSLKNKSARIHDSLPEEDIQDFNPTDNVCSINNF